MSDFDELVTLLARTGNSDPNLYGGIEAWRATAVLDWLATHDQELRERIALKIEGEMVCCTREDPCRATPNICTWGRVAARIARGDS